MATSTTDYCFGVTIGEGSFGRVVHARHKASGIDVAIKVFDKATVHKRPGLFQSVWTERSLLLEFQSSPVVVNLWGAFLDDNCVYLVMECLKGGDLRFLIREGLERGLNKTLWRTTVVPHYALQLIKAVEFLQRNATLHLDLKPENVLLTQRGRIKLADFGSAIRMSQARSRHSEPLGIEHHPKRRDRPIVCGTVDYASPEVLRGACMAELGTAADLWSLGCIFGTLLWGESPFHAASDALALDSIMNYANGVATPHFLVGEELEELPLGWRELIVGLLHPNPDKRLGAFDGISLCDLVPQKGMTDLDLDPPFLPPEPSWIKESRNSTMTDGNLGWGSFLL